jgi:hypothetical protein
MLRKRPARALGACVSEFSKSYLGQLRRLSAIA